MNLKSLIGLFIVILQLTYLTIFITADNVSDRRYYFTIFCIFMCTNFIYNKDRL